jgi:hypothetical protein
MAKGKHLRLFCLGDALGSLDLLIRTADHWLRPEACDALANELEPLVRIMSEKFKAHVPELVLPFTLDCDERIDEVVEIETRSLDKSLGHLERLASTSAAPEATRS